MEPWANIPRELDIRTDFGRVAQAFPLDESLFHDRPAFREAVRRTALRGRHQLVTAPPGAGKSWELTRLAGELRAEGATVARHYCYLEPGDALIERRITIDVFFGNLLSELVDSAPELLGAGDARYAADLPELEATLAKAATLGRPVVLIVDGLDHIARVLSESSSLGDDETDIVEQLATLDIPPGVALVIGSQPGHHLDPLRTCWKDTCIERDLPQWDRGDLVALISRHGARQSLAVIGITDEDEIERIVVEMADRADGNPLYARYLARALVSGLQEGSITSPHDWTEESPAIQGDVAVYYAWLYRTSSAPAQFVADLLGVIDFAVTEGELREMLPRYLGPHLSPLLRNLSPVLTSIAGQGGVRVFHESFRRFMTAELKRQGRSPADVLAPVITWLDGRGFFADAKAYRFLLPALRRASRDSEVLSRVNITFVSHSVEQAHPLDAILRNLALASDVAARARDWPALTRCIELHRSAHTCFDESQNTWRDYWTAYVELFGPKSLAERLLFDGRPTLNRSDGLLACALVDDAGGTAPWIEYLSLPVGDDRSPPAYFDDHGKLDADELTTLAVIQGRCRLGEQQRIIRWAARYLCSCNNDFKPLFLRAIAARLARMTSPALIERIASWSDPLRSGKPRITPRASALLRLGTADEYARLGDRLSASAAALSALRDADTPELAIACVEYGAPGDLAVHAAVPLAGLTIAVGTDDFLRPENDVRTWVASVRLISRDRVNGAQILELERRRLGSGGWYRCWLHYVIEMALADSADLSGQRGDIANAFHELVRDMHPFRGKPRACDLHAIHNVIAETVSWGLSLIRSEPEWRSILNDLSLVSKETASRLDQEDGGPLPTGTLIEILMPYAKDPTGGLLVRETIEHHVAYRDMVGTYYPTHADYAMRLARTRNAGGDVARAREAWAQGAVYLAAYGWHKDATLYEIIQSIPALSSLSQQEALRFVADVQPLANAVIVHTDHRSTNHAPNAWFLSLLRVHAVGALSLLATTITEDDHTSAWPILQAIHDVAKHVGDIASPILIDAMLSTLRLKIDYDNETEAPLNLRLTPVIRLAAEDHSRARQSLRRIAAEVAGVGGRHAKAVAAHLERSALELGMPLPLILQEAESDSQPRHRPGANAQTDTQHRSWIPRTPAFPADASMVELLAGLRAAGRIRRDDEHVAWPQVLLPLSYHLCQLVDQGRESDAHRLLRFFARDTDIAMTARVHPLGRLAEMLDAADPRYAQLACIAYALAYSATTLGRWSIRFSDQTHHPLATRARAIDSELAKQIVIDEVAYYLRGNWYSVGSCSHLVELLTRWNQSSTAEKVWREAFSVVAYRLPLPPPSGWFATLDPDALPDWTVDESLIALLLARLSDPLLSVKKAAMAGIVRSLRQRPEDIVKPLRWWLARNGPVTSVLLVLDILWRIESEPFTVTRAVEDILAEYVQVPASNEAAT